jgi:LuxR family maltose regulon positive regulatory protein
MLAWQIIRGQYLLACGEAKAALKLLQPLLTQAQAEYHLSAAVEIQLLIAQTYLQLQDEQQARVVLLSTLAQAHQQGLYQTILAADKTLIHLLRSLLPVIQSSTLQTYARTLLKDEHQSEDADTTVLSIQEQRVLRLLATGWSNQQIADELIISINTVKYHIKNLYQKLGVSNRLQAREAGRSFLQQEDG